MIDRGEAQRIVENELRSLEDDDVYGLVVCSELTIERSFGWVFFYDSQRHIETGEFQFALAGNAPFIVNRHTGALSVTGTARPVEDYIREYEAALVAGEI